MTDVTIYTRSWCGYCHAAKDLLARKGVPFMEIDIERTPGAREAMIGRAGGRATVPQIFVGSTHVGGYDDFAALDRQGGFDPLLADA